MRDNTSYGHSSQHSWTPIPLMSIAEREMGEDGGGGGGGGGGGREGGGD